MDVKHMLQGIRRGKAGAPRSLAPAQPCTGKQNLHGICVYHVNPPAASLLSGMRQARVTCMAACSGFLRSWQANGLDQRVLQRVRDILDEPGTSRRRVYVTG